MMKLRAFSRNPLRFVFSYRERQSSLVASAPFNSASPCRILSLAWRAGGYPIWISIIVIRFFNDGRQRALAINMLSQKTAAAATRHFTGSGGISCEEKQIILDEHNRLRQLVALGQIHGQPGAANMMEMVSRHVPPYFLKVYPFPAEKYISRSDSQR